MTASYRLVPIPTLPTLRVMRGTEVVGLAFRPKVADEPWEVFPDINNRGGLPDGDIGYKPRQFDSLDAVEAFLGIAREAQAA